MLKVILFKIFTMNYLQLKKHFTNHVKNIYPQKEIESFFYVLCQHFLNVTKVGFLLKPNATLSKPEFEKFEKAIEQLQQEEPIQYIIGHTEFYGLTLNVNQNVLIPRPETEELVDWIIKDTIENKGKLKILDIGTGSGCIAISLANDIKSSHVYALDISKKALEIAKKNTKQNHVIIQFLEKDILTEHIEIDGFDIIVSNPPYVRNLEKKHMKNNVLNYEPHLALFVKDKEPLIFYAKIAQFAQQKLKNKGWLYLEINEYLGKETIELLQNNGLENITLKKDVFGADRMIRAQKN